MTNGFKLQAISNSPELFCAPRAKGLKFAACVNFDHRASQQPAKPLGGRIRTREMPMRTMLRNGVLSTLCLFFALLSPAFAQQQAAATNRNAAFRVAATAQPPSAPAATGKERLGEKWTDEQRVNNCKVPFDKRGSKFRPDTCPALTSK
jgi:hypothetical protein